mmetsp:Transcript_6630/g.24097  ORF Transcript_6630/g.24097 Transcript_6630/m.24097 type:complete len:212 (-) Transcript_6630:356-991(-)
MPIIVLNSGTSDGNACETALRPPPRAELDPSRAVSSSKESNVAFFHAFSASSSCLLPGRLRGNVDSNTSQFGLPTPDPRTSPLVEIVKYPPFCFAVSSPINRRKKPLQSSFRVGHASHRPAPAPGHAFTTSRNNSQRPGPTSATAPAPAPAVERSTTGTTKILLCSNRRRYGVAATKSFSTLFASPYTTAILATSRNDPKSNIVSSRNLFR